MVPPHLEFELRFALDPKRLPELTCCEQLRELSVGSPLSRELHSIYFDTEELRLHRRGHALRVRGDGKGWLQTLKRAAGAPSLVRAREEYESPVADPLPDVEGLCDPEIRERVQKWTTKRPLVPVFETRVLRTTRRLNFGASNCLLEIDVGEIRAGNAALPICEVELEHERGDLERLFELATELNASIGFRFESESKADRGYRLFRGERPRARKAVPVELDRVSTLGEAMLASVHSCAEQIVANLACARQGVDPEGVHQLRVGTRRLRAALGLFKRALPEHEWMNLRRELRWLASKSGPVRDLDVFVEHHIVPAARFVADPKPLDCLHESAAMRRSSLQEAFRAELDSARFTRLLLVLGRWLQRYSAEGIGRAAYRARLSQPAREFASHALAQRYARAEARGARAATGSTADRHALRIELKKLRYASEFLADLFPKKRGRRFARELERLQELLGSLNDVRVARRLARSLCEGGGEVSRAGLELGASVVDGWTAHQAARAEQKLAKSWKRFTKIEPFWSG